MPAAALPDPLADALLAIVSEGFDPDTSAPPGALVALAQDDSVAYSAIGLANTETRTPMAFSTATDAGSVTKIVATAASLMALVDAGAINLDSPVSRYLPSVAGPTLRDLLEHQGGLWEWWPLYLAGARDGDALRLARTLPPRYPLGAGRHYSDIGFILLGAVVSAVTGTDVATAAGELVFAPFRLHHTGYAAPVPGLPVAASSPGDAIEREMVRTGTPYPVRGHVEDFGGWRSHTLVGEVNDGNAFHAFGGTAGHAGVFTTAGDLLQFCTVLRHGLAGGGPVRPETINAFLTPGRDPGQALGFRVWQAAAGGPAYGHSGFPGVAFALLPERDASLVMITNRLHVSGPLRPTDTMWLRVLGSLQWT